MEARALYHFSLATNFDPALPDALAAFHDEQPRARVERVFGSLPADWVGGGRPAYRLPAIALDGLADHLAAMAAHGIGFAYTLNAPDLFGAEADPDWRAGLDRFLGQLWDAGVRRLVVSNRWLLDHLRAHHRFELSLSLIHGVRTAEQAAGAAALGVDEITVHGQAVNRDLAALARIRAATDVTLAINANMACLVGCAMADDHYRTLGALSRRDHGGAGAGTVHTEPQILACSCAMLADPTLFVRSSFVPPSYLPTYSELGVERFKFSDRTSDSATLLRTARAYAAAELEPDLFDFVYKRGAKLVAGLRGVLPAAFVAAIQPPRLTIDARRFHEVRFIEAQATLPPGELRALANTILTVHDPDGWDRYRRFLEAVRDRVAGRSRIPADERPAFAALRGLLTPDGAPSDPAENPG